MLPNASEAKFQVQKLIFTTISPSPIANVYTEHYSVDCPCALIMVHKLSTHESRYAGMDQSAWLHTIMLTKYELNKLWDRWFNMNTPNTVIRVIARKIN